MELPEQSVIDLVSTLEAIEAALKSSQEVRGNSTISWQFLDAVDVRLAKFKDGVNVPALIAAQTGDTVESRADYFAQLKSELGGSPGF